MSDKLNSFAYSKTWLSAADFPTIETEESQVRADIQYLYDEIAAGLNTVISAINTGAEVRYVTYGTSTNSDIDALFGDGAIVACKRQFTGETAYTVCYLMHHEANFDLFASVYPGNDANKRLRRLVCNNNSWSELTIPVAPLDSPHFTGTPTAPTASDPSTNTTQIATTAFVQTVAANEANKKVRYVTYGDSDASGKIASYYTADDVVAVKYTFSDSGDVSPTVLYLVFHGSNYDMFAAVRSNGGVPTLLRVICDNGSWSAHTTAMYVKPSGGIPAADIADGAVTEGKIADGAVTTDKIADGAVQYNNIHDDSIYPEHICINAVTTEKIKDKNVTKDKLEDSVQTSLGKADSAYQKQETGIPKTDLASAVQTSLGKADTALQSAHEVPSGGTTGQVLAKKSNTNYDLEWVNQSGGGNSSSFWISSDNYAS